MLKSIPPEVLMMKFATKKECSALLAFLGEENWRSANIQHSSCPFAQVSWVDDHILTVRQAGGHFLLRISAALSIDDEETAERLLEAAAMREAEDYCFSVRKVCGFVLAEVTGYVQTILGRKGIEEEYQKLRKKLDGVLSPLS